MGGWVRVCFFKGKLLTFIEKTWVHGRPGKDSRHLETIPNWSRKTQENLVIFRPKPGISNFLRKTCQLLKKMGGWVRVFIFKEKALDFH